MPLFIIISGYVTRYSKPLSDGKSLLSFVKKALFGLFVPVVGVDDPRQRTHFRANFFP